MGQAAGIAMVAAAIAGAATGALGKEQQGQDQAQYYNNLAETADKQQGLIDQETAAQNTATQTAASVQATRQANQAKEISGAQKAAMAANGTAGGSVSSEQVGEDTITKADMDAALIQYNANAKVTAANNQAAVEKWNLQTQSAGYRQGAENSIVAGNTAAVSSLLGGVGNVADTWGRADQMGMMGSGSSTQTSAS